MKDTFYLSDKRSKLKPFVRYEQPHEIKRNEKLSASIPKQEYPAADDAKPAAVGKLFSEQIWMCLSLCSDSLPFLKCSSWDSFLTRKHQSLLKYTKFFFFKWASNNQKQKQLLLWEWEYKGNWYQYTLISLKVPEKVCDQVLVVYVIGWVGQAMFSTAVPKQNKFWILVSNYFLNYNTTTQGTKTSRIFRGNVILARVPDYLFWKQFHTYVTGLFTENKQLHIRTKKQASNHISQKCKG